MGLAQLIYASQPFGFDETVLRGILSDARRRNQRDDITGALICRADIYLQLLEGPSEGVEAAFGRIAHDNRHLEVQRLFFEPIEDRLFPAWAMRDDPARSWMWSERQVAGGAVSEATHAELLAIFQRLADSPAQA